MLTLETAQCTRLHKSIFGVKVEEVWQLAMSNKTSINIMFEVSSSSAEGIPNHKIKDVNIQTYETLLF